MLTLRIRYLPVPPRPNAIDTLVIDPGYRLSALVRVIETALRAKHRFLIRREDGHMQLIDTQMLQTIAVRETH